MAPGSKVSPFDLVDTHPEDDVVPDPRQAEMQKQLDKGLKDTFPASDPVSALQPITAGPSEEGSEAMAADGEACAAPADIMPKPDQGHETASARSASKASFRIG